MTTVTTSKGKTFKADWIWGPTLVGRNLMIQIEDARAISAIAKDFEDVDVYHAYDEDTGEKVDHEGFTQIDSIARSLRNADEHEVIQIALSKPKE